MKQAGTPRSHAPIARPSATLSLGKTWLVTVMLAALALLFAYPFAWMALAGFKPNDAIFQAWPLWPEGFPLTAFKRLLSGELVPFARQFANTFFIASAQTALALALCVSAGFVLARYTFRFKPLILVLAFLVVMIPRQAMVLPLFVWNNHLGLLDTPFAVILPGAVSGLGLLFFTQAWKRIPEECLNLARVEGASEVRTFWIVLPLMKPGLFAYGLIHFVFAWQEHLIPLVMLNSPHQLTMGISLATLNGSSLHTPYNLLMAGSTLAVFPAFLVFVLLFRHLRTSLSEMAS
jgi:ABC-type glycerol-3-phosphate transport system permease component